MDPAKRIAREDMLRRAVLAGDEAAWQAWCLEVFDDLYEFAIWRCGGRRDAADELVQETWLVAVRQIRRFDPQQASFLSWLRGIAVNVRRNQLRHLQRRSKHLRPAGGPVPEVPCANWTDGNGEDAEQIARALDELSERQEAVLRAKYLDGQSVAEIAAVWNESPKAVESLLSRARQAFREQFEKRANVE
jgi:RNA polymerase sigma-70 factor (ECF subfamily)